MPTMECYKSYYISTIRLLQTAWEISGCDFRQTSFLFGWSAVQQPVNSQFLSSQFGLVAAKLFLGSQKSHRTQVGYLPERLVDLTDFKVRMNTHTHVYVHSLPPTHTYTHSLSHTCRNSFSVLMANISWLICLSVWTTESERDREIKTNDRDWKRGWIIETKDERERE